MRSPIAPSGSFPGSSVGKESTCNAGDPSSIPGSGRSIGEGIGYPFQYSRTSLVAQTARFCQQCGRPGFDPWVGKIPWRREWRLTLVLWPGVPSGSSGKESVCNTGDTGDVSLIPGSGRSAGEGNGCPLQYFFLTNPMDRGIPWQAAVHSIAILPTILSFI